MPEYEVEIIEIVTRKEVLRVKARSNNDARVKAAEQVMRSTRAVTLRPEGETATYNFGYCVQVPNEKPNG